MKSLENSLENTDRNFAKMSKKSSRKNFLRNYRKTSEKILRGTPGEISRGALITFLKLSYRIRVFWTFRIIPVVEGSSQFLPEGFSAENSGKPLDRILREILQKSWEEILEILRKVFWKKSLESFYEKYWEELREKFQDDVLAEPRKNPLRNIGKNFN